MRWKTEPEPKLGDTRWVKKFAWLPVETDKGFKLWLESYYVKQKRSEVLSSGLSAGGFYWYPDWVLEATVAIEDYVKQKIDDMHGTKQNNSLLGKTKVSEEKSVDSHEGVTRYDLTPEQKDSLKSKATYIPGAEGYTPLPKTTIPVKIYRNKQQGKQDAIL